MNINLVVLIMVTFRDDFWFFYYRPKGLGNDITENSKNGYSEVRNILNIGTEESVLNWCELERKKDGRASPSSCRCNSDVLTNCYYMRKTFKKVEEERDGYYNNIVDNSKKKYNFRKNDTTFFGYLELAPWTDKKVCEKARVDDTEKEPIGSGCVLFEAESGGGVVAGWGYYWKEKDEQTNDTDASI